MSKTSPRNLIQYLRKYLSNLGKQDGGVHGVDEVDEVDFLS